MKVAGITAEYNPFHQGHAYHIRRTLEALGGDVVVVCAMSGDFVQRGEPAVFSKFVRAEAACRCGADLVVELPLPWSLATAESFARAAVAILDGVGCSHLSFGSESGELEKLQALAQALNTPELRAGIDAQLAANDALGYAQARQRAAEQYGLNASLLSQPNNILALEYLKAIDAEGLNLQPITIKRFGSAHDGTGGELQSAAELRRMLGDGENIAPWIPEPAAEVFMRAEEEGRGRPDSLLLEAAMLSRLRGLQEESYLSLHGAEGGLGRRLYRAAMTEGEWRSVIEAAKTKRYTESRIRRTLCFAALGIDADCLRGAPPYARVLAANARGREYLCSVRDKTKLPLVTKPAAVRGLGTRAEDIFTLSARAHDLYVLGLPSAEARRGGADWKTGPAIL